MFNIECNYQISINKENKFIAEINEGEKVCVKTINAYGDKFKNLEELQTLIDCKDGKTHHHPLTGPIYIKNAKPGDVLKIHIYQIKVEEMAQSLSKSAGITSLENSDQFERWPVISSRNQNGEIEYFDKITLPYRSMIGMIATTPKEGTIRTRPCYDKKWWKFRYPFYLREY